MTGEQSDARPIIKDLYCRASRLAARLIPDTPPDVVNVPCVDPVRRHASRTPARRIEKAPAVSSERFRVATP
jgi:hypothetical protein